MALAAKQFTIRPMTQQDIQQVLQIQSECYTKVALEEESTIRARLLASPDTAWVAENTDGIGAYLMGYQSVLGKVTPLDGGFEVAPQANSLYLHDLAVSVRLHGTGVGSALVQFACGHAQRNGMLYSTLVSVQNTSHFWAKHGYAIWDELDQHQAANLRSYITPCHYMAKTLQS